MHFGFNTPPTLPTLPTLQHLLKTDSCQNTAGVDPSNFNSDDPKLTIFTFAAQAQVTGSLVCAHTPDPYPLTTAQQELPTSLYLTLTSDTLPITNGISYKILTIVQKHKLSSPKELIAACALSDAFQNDEKSNYPNFKYYFSDYLRGKSPISNENINFHCMGLIVRSLLEEDLNCLHAIPCEKIHFAYDITKLIFDLSNNSLTKLKCNLTIEKINEIYNDRKLIEPFSIKCKTALQHLQIAIRKNNLSGIRVYLDELQAYDKENNSKFNQHHWDGIYKAVDAILLVRETPLTITYEDMQKTVNSMVDKIKIKTDEWPTYTVALKIYSNSLPAIDSNQQSYTYQIPTQ